MIFYLLRSEGLDLCFELCGLELYCLLDCFYLEFYEVALLFIKYGYACGVGSLSLVFVKVFCCLFFKSFLEPCDVFIFLFFGDCERDALFGTLARIPWFVWIYLGWVYYSFGRFLNSLAH